MADDDFLFQKLAKNSPIFAAQSNVRKSLDWFRAKAIQTATKASELFRNDSQNFIGSVTPRTIGRMVMFHYDPKHKKTLPFYDRFPLVFPIELYDDGFLGINLHYLRPSARAGLMTALYTTLNNKSLNEKTQLVLSYKILASASKFGGFQKCVKRYLNTHLTSRIYVVDPLDWDKVLMLPTERFAKATNEEVWSS